MFKEIKIFFYIISIFLFLFLTTKYYFSDANIKNYFRNINNIDDTIKNNSQNLLILESDTDNIIDYNVTGNKNKKNKKFSFWELLGNNE